MSGVCLKEACDQGNGVWAKFGSGWVVYGGVITAVKGTKRISSLYWAR